MTKHSVRKKLKDQILIRNLGPWKERLRRQAERNGQSMEQLARDILCDALKDESRFEKGLGTRIAQRFQGLGIREGEIKELRGYDRAGQV